MTDTPRPTEPLPPFDEWLECDDYAEWRRRYDLLASSPAPAGLDAAMAFLRKRLVGTPPNVDSEDVWFASLLDEAEAVGRAATRPAEPETER